jgi:uncharacterized membrane protein HdeD (DUF308 family)
LAIILGIMILISAVIMVPMVPITKKAMKEKKIWIWVLVVDILMFIVGIAAVKNASTFGVALITIPVGIILLAVGIGYIAVSVNLLKKGSQSDFLKEPVTETGEVVDVEYTDVDE